MTDRGHTGSLVGAGLLRAAMFLLLGVLLVLMHGESTSGGDAKRGEKP